jgi:hypothetical protein
VVKNVLVTETLSESMKEAGSKLIERLDDAQSQVVSALWFFVSEEKVWKVIIASPLVKKDGPRNFYERVLKANSLATAEEEIVSLNDIRATNPSDPLIKMISSIFDSPKGASNARVTRTSVNGHFIEDAYIYRLNDQSSM